MTSFPTPNIITNFVSGGDLSAGQYRPVAISGENAVLLANTTTRKNPIGVLMTAPNSATGSVCEIATVGGGAKVLAGETITAGDPLTANSSGRAVVAQSGDYIFARALENAVNGDVFACLVGNELSNPSLVQELTASGAVSARVQSVELNHATVVVAATIADAADHQGLFVVKNTSASGTAAHTLTLTSGTFDGTNNVATLNAPNECLVVYFDSAGNGTIVENVGTVALS